MNILKVEAVNKEYPGGTKALRDINFSIKEGEFVSIIGPSGAGKSTMLRAINKMIDIDSGNVIFNNFNVMSASKGELRNIRRKIGMIFQHYNLVDRLSVIENVLHGRLGYKNTLEGIIGKYTEEEKENAFKILKRLGLEEEAYKRCDKLSGGQKQRVGIGRALIQEPKLILCDEPIAALDPNAAKIIMDYLKDINNHMKITCILNLHQVDVAIKYSTRIIGINSGKVLYDGSPEDLTKETIHAIYGSEAGNLIID